MSLETFADFSKTWIKRAKHFTIFRRNVLLFQSFSVPARDSSDTQIRTGIQFLGRASRSEPVTWLNMG